METFVILPHSIVHISIQTNEIINGSLINECIWFFLFFSFSAFISMCGFYRNLHEQNELSAYGENSTFVCLKCAEGCDTCKDSSPCVAALNWPMRTSIVVLACAVIGFLPPAAWFTFRYQQVKVSVVPILLLFYWMCFF